MGKRLEGLLAPVVVIIDRASDISRLRDFVKLT